MAKQQLEQIDEQPECCNTTDNNENYDLKKSDSVTDIKRLCGGCMGKKEKGELDSIESVQHEDSQEWEPEPKPLLRPSLDIEKEILPQSSPKKVCKFEGPLSPKQTYADTNCERIEHLEEQIEKMHIDLNHIRKNMVPPEDIQKFSVLSERLHEINGLLTELKFNCLRLQQTSNEDTLRSYPEREMETSTIGQQQRPSVPTYLKDSRPRYDYAHRRYSEPQTKKYLRTFEHVEANGYHDEDTMEVFDLKNPRTRPVHKEFKTRKQIRANGSGSPYSDSDEEPYPEVVECARRETDPYFPSEWFNSPTDSLEWTTPPAQSTPTHYEERKAQQQSNRSPRWNEANRLQKQCTRQNMRRMSQPSPVTDKDVAPQHNIRRYSAPHTVHNPDIRTKSSSKRDLQTSNAGRYIRRTSDPHETRKKQQIFRRNSAGRENNLSASGISSPDERSVSDKDENISYIHAELPLITKDLLEAILQSVGKIDHSNVALTVILQSNNLYHINISVTHTGQSLGDVYTTEAALKQAERKCLFERFLTFFILNSTNTLEQKNRILGHSFAFINTENCQTKRSESLVGDRMNSKTICSKQSQTLEYGPHTSTEIGSEISLEMSQKSKHLLWKVNNYDDDNNRLKAGKGLDDLEKPKYVNMHQGSASNTTEFESKDKSERIRRLEEKVQSLRQELSEIRDELVPQEDFTKFSKLSERLEELNVLLVDLTNSHGQLTFQKDTNYAPPSAECKHFSDEINNKPTLLEKHLLMMKDFRTDAELRRQRVLKKRQEKRLQTLRNYSNRTGNNEMLKVISESKAKLSIGDDFDQNSQEAQHGDHTLEINKHRIEKSAQYSHYDLHNLKTFGKQPHKSQSEIPQGKCLKVEWATTHIPPIPTKTTIASPQTGSILQGNEIHTVTSETQTDHWPNIPSYKEFSKNHLRDYNSSWSEMQVEAPTDTDSAVRQTSTEDYSISPTNLPIIHSNLRNNIQDILGHQDHSSVALTIVLETDNLYHINISMTHSGKSLACLYATEKAIQQAKDQDVFAKFLTFFIVNAENTLEQKKHLLGHSFEIIKVNK